MRELSCRSQESIAEEAKLSQRRINEYVRGRGNPRFTSLLGLCKGLHLTFEELVKRVEDREGAGSALARACVQPRQ